MRIAVLGLLLSSSLTFACLPTLAQTPADKAGKADLVERSFTQQSYLYSQLIEHCFTFKLSPTCWAKFSDPANTENDSGLGTMNYWCRYVTEYAKRQGLGDLEALKSGSPQDQKDNRPQMDAIINKLKAQFSMRIEAPSACTAKGYELLRRYPYEVLERIGYRSPVWSPKSGQAHFRVILNPTVRDITVSPSADGRQLTIIGPAQQEAPYTANENIRNGLERVNKNR